MELTNTAELSAMIPEETPEVVIDYYDVRTMEKGLHLNSCMGDLYKICNVFYDYELIMREMHNIWGEEMRGNQIMYDVYADQLKRVREKIERTIGYSVEKALVECENKKARKHVKDDGIGEDAFVLAVKRGAEAQKKKTTEAVEAAKNKKSSKPKEEPKKEESDEFEQMSLLLEQEEEPND